MTLKFLVDQNLSPLTVKYLGGLIFLRVHPQNFEILHPVLKDFFERVKEERIKNSLIVIENDRFRIRKVK